MGALGISVQGAEISAARTTTKYCWYTAISLSGRSLFKKVRKNLNRSLYWAAIFDKMMRVPGSYSMWPKLFKCRSEHQTAIFFAIRADSHLTRAGIGSWRHP